MPHSPQRKEEFDHMECSAWTSTSWELNSGCSGGQRVVGQKCTPSDVLLGEASKPA